MLLRRIGYPLAFAAIFLAAGGHWIVLQSVAWGRMWIDYSAHAGAKQALVETFDGAHLCPLCKAVMHGAEKEQKASPSLVSQIKAEVFIAARHVFIFPVPQLVGTLNPCFSFSPPSNAPPLLPPPRTALV